MKTSKRCAAPLALPLLVAIFLLAGCAGLGKGFATYPSATLQSVADDYRQAELQSEATEESLEGLAIANYQDLRQAFNFFTVNRDQMEQAGSRLVTHADGMLFRGTYYFVESGKSLEACAIPRSTKSDDRRSIDLGEDFDAVSAAGGEVKRAFRAFQLDIGQIHGSLASSLTPVTVDALDQMLRKAKVDSDSLQYALSQALAALEHAKITLAQGAQK
jgi:hypothetical protein